MDLQLGRVLPLDLSLGGLMPPEVSRSRRWVADPLVTMVLLAALSVGLVAGAPAATSVLVLSAVVVAGVSLSGST